MDMVFFVKALAWLFAVLSGLVVAGRLGMWHWYNNTTAGQLDRALDAIRHGGTATFPIMLPGIVFLVCVVALLSMRA